MSRAVLMALVLCAGFLMPGCDGKPAASSAPAPPAVTVSLPLQKKITEWDEYTGRFAATKTVEIRARVSGFLDSIHFKDGEIVNQGDLLFIIDQRPYRLAVEQAKADVERARAKLDIATSDLDRAAPLLRNQTLTAREFETRRATQREAIGVLNSAETAVKQAELNLEWAEVRAPIAGRISDRRVDVGNLITGGQSGATLLTNIVSMDPIHFLFDGSEADFLRYVRLRVAGTSGPRRNMETPVSVRLADEAEYKHHGTLDFVDNSINPKTGTIRGRALIKNENEILLPGYFGRLRLFAGERDVLLIPDSAISSDQASKIVFTVGPDDVVVTKQVELGPIVEGLRVIRSGLAANDRIVIEGIQRARPGKKVTAENGRIEASGESTARINQ